MEQLDNGTWILVWSPGILRRSNRRLMTQASIKANSKGAGGNAGNPKEYGGRTGDSNHDDGLDHHGVPGDRDCDDAHARWRPEGSDDVCGKKKRQPDTPTVVDTPPPWIYNQCVSCPADTFLNTTLAACQPEYYDQHERK